MTLKNFPFVFVLSCMTLCLGLCPSVAHAQTADTLNILRLMESLPDLENGATTLIQRLDMSDYRAAGNNRFTKNSLESGFRISSFSPHKVTLENSDLTYKVTVSAVPVKNDTLLVSIVNVALAPDIDSCLIAGSVKLFTSDGKLLDHIVSPAYSSWLVNPGKISADSLESIFRDIPLVVASADFDPQSGLLTFTSRLDAYFSKDERPGSLEALKKEVIYRLKGKKFKLQ